jgi:hypothetical protein
MSEQSAAPAAPAASSEAAPVESSEQSNQSQAESSAEGSSVEAAAEQLQEAVENGEISQKEANKLIKKFQLKVDGKTVEREVDLSDEDYIKQMLQLAEVSKSRMSETANIKKAFQSEMGRLKQDPWAVMKDLGLDPDELAEMRIQQRIEEMKKSPEQVAQEKIQKELQEAREEAKKLKEEKEQLEMSKLQEQAAVQLEEEIMGALDGHRTLPKSQYVVKRIADSMLWAMNNGFGDVSAEDVVPLVEKEMRDELNRFMDEMPEDLMEKYIGQRNIDRLRKRRVSAAKAAVPSVNDIKPTNRSLSAEKKQEAPKQKIPARDFFKKVGR